ncbi:monocarboxylate transporter 12-like [Patiria miniata]|uniref:Major facilitator superfamily (MFS) profile domain-containing protein n=1 Tax=Patiria miniata TaxID=46514 RepID=A0A914BBM8_PATMI|nr:monocarboxylate transporter 12-like [Patiria miniata]XP_038073633.1 monocarboxylate transporter 12-like [Patiria miniata]
MVSAGLQQPVTVNYDQDRWGWLMVAAAFVNAFVIMGQLKALGVLLIPMTNDFDSELWLVGWVAVLYSMTQDCFAPVVGALSRLLGARPMIVMGGVLYTLGLILASISPSVPLLAVFVIGLSGFGASFNWYIGFAVMASYFKEKYPLAIGLSTMGIPLGIMAYGPVTQVLLNTYGWRGTMLLLGGISFHLVACALLVRRDPSSNSANSDTDQYQEVLVLDEEENAQEEGDAPNHTRRTQEKREKTYCQRLIEAMDFKVLADKRFALLVCGGCSAAFAYSAWLVFMVPYGKFQGLNDTQASFLPTAFGIGNVIGKLLAPLLQELGMKLPMTFWACFGAALISGSFVVNAFIRPFIGLLAVTGLVGVGYAAMYQAIDVILRFISTDDRLVSILAWQGVFAGVAGALGGLVSGWIYEWTGTFFISFFVYAGVTLLSIPFFIMEAAYDKQTH